MECGTTSTWLGLLGLVVTARKSYERPHVDMTSLDAVMLNRPLLNRLLIFTALLLETSNFLRLSKLSNDWMVSLGYLTTVLIPPPTRLGTETLKLPNCLP